MYTLTQDQVKELAQGKSIQKVLPEAFKLEVGKWYKCSEGGSFLVFTEKLHGLMNQNNSIEGYGINGNGEWAVFDKNYLAASHDIELATREEVEAMLFVEFVKKYKIGYTIKTVNGIERKIAGLLTNFNFEKNILYLSDNNFELELFNNGQWAEIITESKSKSDILTELIDYATTNDNLWLKNQLEKLR